MNLDARFKALRIKSHEEKVENARKILALKCQIKALKLENAVLSKENIKCKL